VISSFVAHSELSIAPYAATQLDCPCTLFSPRSLPLANLLIAADCDPPQWLPLKPPSKSSQRAWLAFSISLMNRETALITLLLVSVSIHSSGIFALVLC
jgi:hypothetical protein